MPTTLNSAGITPLFHRSKIILLALLSVLATSTFCVAQFEPQEFRRAIRGALIPVALWSPEAEELLFMTAAVESDLGAYTKQINGPARGVFQMEPGTERDLLRYVEERRPEYLKTLTNYSSRSSSLSYQILMARLYYLRIDSPIPADPFPMARYYKKYWNTPLGKSSPGKALIKYAIYRD